MKLQAAGGQDQFGGALLKAGSGGAADPGGRGNPVTIDKLECFFDSLAAAAATGKTVLHELVNTNSTLTSSIADLSATNN